MNAIKYPSIGQFRNLIKAVRTLDPPHTPTLLLTGTVKLHGTNASVLFNEVGQQFAQSKNHILSLEADNLGFARWHQQKISVFDQFYRDITEAHKLSGHYRMVIYGEWAGRGIQDGVAVSQLDPFFYIFGVKLVWEDGTEQWLANYPVLQCGKEILDSRTIWTRQLEVDFIAPEAVQNELVAMTQEVEALCPVGLALGVEGLGEGVVWSHISQSGVLLACKVKGERHSVTRVTTLAEVEVEKINSIEAFVCYAATENRFKQGLFEVCQNRADKAQFGDFVRWLLADIQKEEADTIAANGLAMQDIGKRVSLRARQWFFKQLAEA